MIHKIWASDKRFRAIEFHAGLNVILAERTPESGEQDTRNGAGKTTVLNVIHFCLGADFRRLDLPKNELKDWIFYITIDLFGQIVTANRSVSNPKRIEIDSTIPNAPISAEKNLEGMLVYNNDDWKKLLGKYLFGIEKEAATKYAPSFRSLVAYFIRHKKDAYIDPFKYISHQNAHNTQMNNALLLGLNWRHVADAQIIKDKEKNIKAQNTIISSGANNQGELEFERLRIEKELMQESKDIESFRVHPQYEKLQKRADQLTEEIHAHANKALLLRRKLSRYEKSVSEEKSPDIDSVEKLFAEADIHFSENIKKTLNDAKEFHRKIIRHRKLFLEAEITQIKNTLILRDNKIKETSDQRAELLQLLETHGALDEFSLLQKRVIEQKEYLESIKNKISDIKEIQRLKQAVKAAKFELGKKLRRDYEQDSMEREKAMTLFHENSEILYGKPGGLIINTTDDGYKLNIEMRRNSSKGVGLMKIFCYDLMLIELMTQRRGIDFLVHDSNILDGVDPRQKARALMLAHKKASEKGFQYICALNSDAIPTSDFEKDFQIAKYVRLTLKDQMPEDAALGFHFELTKKSNKIKNNP